MTAYTDADMEKARVLSPCNCQCRIGGIVHRMYCGFYRQLGIAAALAAEREAQRHSDAHFLEMNLHWGERVVQRCAHAIRARGK